MATFDDLIATVIELAEPTPGSLTEGPGQPDEQVQLLDERDGWLPVRRLAGKRIEALDDVGVERTRSRPLQISHDREPQASELLEPLLTPVAGTRQERGGQLNERLPLRHSGPSLEQKVDGSREAPGAAADTGGPVVSSE